MPAPRFRVPYAVAWMAAAAMEGVSRITRRPPAVPLTAVRMARKRMYFSAAKAIQELGLPQTPAETALADAVAWFTDRGYAGAKRNWGSAGAMSGPPHTKGLKK